MKKIITIICVLFTLTATQAQKKNAKLTIEVDGVCNMCKGRIEKAALTTKGVKYANWNVTTHELSLIINENKTNKKSICEVLAKAGHDSKDIKATIEDYNNLHPCCKYRDEEIINHHKVE